MDVNEFQELSKRTMPEPINFNGKEKWSNSSKANYAMGIGGETGELVDDIKKEIFHGHPLDLDKRKKEVGDILHYVAGICTMYGFTMEEAMELNIEKLKKRYPNGFNKEDSIKRVDVNGEK